jgi:hypothetical protein
MPYSSRKFLLISVFTSNLKHGIPQHPGFIKHHRVLQQLLLDKIICKIVHAFCNSASEKSVVLSRLRLPEALLLGGFSPYLIQVDNETPSLQVAGETDRRFFSYVSPSFSVTARERIETSVVVRLRRVLSV